MPPGPDTCTGTKELVVVASPSWPLSLRPQHHTVPSDRTAHEWVGPAARSRGVSEDAGPPPPFTWIGVLRSVVVLSPTWPLLLSPQHQAV